MFFRILKNELKRKRTMNLILFLFIAMATMFLASSVSNLITISGAVDYFIDISNVPDSFAISLTEGDEDEIREYLNGNEILTDYEIIDTFNVTNERISIVEATDAPDDRYERTNTLCVQPVTDGYMSVFDQENQPIALKPGEIAFAKLEAEANGLQIGDRVSITVGEIRQEFTIAAITKDAVFGSSMMGFKRLFISEEDFERFADQENLTHTKIYCFNYEDKKEFNAEWQEQNFNVISMIDKSVVPMCFVFDMLIAGILIIVSICLILIAFMVLRFTIVFTLQEDYREIGIMKAIGLKDAGIKGVYLIKYLAIAVLAAGFGEIFSFPFGKMLLGQSIANMVVEQAGQNILLHFLCAMVVVAVVLLFSNASANKLKRFTAIDAIRNGSNGERYQAKGRVKLWKRKHMKPGFFMACNDILSNPKRFLVLATTFCIGTLLILLPLSALHTLTGKHIISLFSMSPSDVYIETGYGDDYVAQKSVDYILKDLERIETDLAEHGIRAQAGTDVGYIIPCYSNDEKELFSYFTLQEIGSWERSYETLEGREPVADDELMITDITAKEMGVTIGDTITYQYPDKTQKFIITGIYQSLMNMGNGFRVSRAAKLDENYISGILCIQIEAPELESAEANKRIKEIFPDYKIMTDLEFFDSMTGDISKTVQMVIYLLAAVVLIINSLITALMMKAMMAKERGDVALLKSIGFSNRSIRMWQVERSLLILVFAIVTATLLSKLLAPVTIGPIFSMMGANKVQLEVKAIETYVIYPMLLLLVTAFVALLCTGSVKGVEAREVNNIE